MQTLPLEPQATRENRVRSSRCVQDTLQPGQDRELVSEPTGKQMGNKKALERSFLAEIAAIYPDFPSGIITNTERPDFLVLGESYITGMEVVGYVRGQGHGGSVDRRNETLRQEIAEEARQVFESSHSDPLMVRFLWHSAQHLRKSDVPDIGASAAKIVGQNIPQSLFDSTRIAGNELVDTALQEFVSSISVTRVRNQALWSSVDAGFVSVPASELQELLASKNAKVQDYLQRCDEVWLLIVADGRYISSTADLPEDIQQVHFRSAFRKVLFYDRPNQRIATLTG